MTEVADIAVISFDRFINGNDANKRAVAKDLFEAFSTVGWVYLKDHGIPQSRVDEVFELVSLFKLLIRTTSSNNQQWLGQIILCAPTPNKTHMEAYRP